MDQSAKMIEAVSSLMWPVIVLLVILRFGPTVRSVIESAKWRKFTVKVGGQELTMDEINKQQRALIADLQAQVVGLQAEPTTIAQPHKEQLVAGRKAAQRKRNVLWVDDNPRNNGYLVQTLREKGIEVEIALSTREGMQRYHPERYGAIVSDMGREELGRYLPDAGIELLKKIRAQDSEVPFFIFCSADKAREYRADALHNGATKITSSPTTVLGALLREFDQVEA